MLRELIPIKYRKPSPRKSTNVANFVYIHATLLQTYSLNLVKLKSANPKNCSQRWLTCMQAILKHSYIIMYNKEDWLDVSVRKSFHILAPTALSRGCHVIGQSHTLGKNIEELPKNKSGFSGRAGKMDGNWRCRVTWIYLHQSEGFFF